MINKSNKSLKFKNEGKWLQMIQKQIKSFSKDIQDKAKQIGLNYLEQKYSGQTITEKTIENEYNEAIEDGTIDPISQPMIEESEEQIEEIESDSEEIQEDEYFYFEDSDIDQITNELGFQVYSNETLHEIKDKFYSLWKDQTKDTNTNQLDDQCKKDNGLPLKQFLFCEEYLKTGKIVDTCKNLGIGKTTAFEYLKKEEVKTYLNERRNTIKEETNQLLETNFQKAMEGLSNLMEDSSFKSDDTRIKAIDTFLKYYSKTIDKDQ